MKGNFIVKTDKSVMKKSKAVTSFMAAVGSWISQCEDLYQLNNTIIGLIHDRKSNQLKNGRKNQMDLLFDQVVSVRFSDDYKSLIITYKSLLDGPLLLSKIEHQQS